MQDSQIKHYHREVRNLDLLTHFYLLIFIFLSLVTFLILSILLIKSTALIIIGAVLLFLYIILSAKYFLIGCVLAYKSYAPMKLRSRCRFEPSCSTYMILAVEKYGFFKGLKKGIQRINRCHAPNGGVDYP